MDSKLSLTSSPETHGLAGMRSTFEQRWSLTWSHPFGSLATRRPASRLRRVLHFLRCGTTLASTAFQPRCDLGNMSALEAGPCELIVGGLPRAVGTCERCCTVGRAARDLVHARQARERVRQSHDDHPVMQERAVEAGNGRLLTTVLGRGRSEHACNL